MFKILFSYSGWQYANYVLNEVKDPIRTIKIAGPLGLGITSMLYIFANVAYFAYVPSHSTNDVSQALSMQCIVKGRHCKLWNDSRISIFRERVWNKGTEGAHRFRSLKVRPLRPLQSELYSNLEVHTSALGYVPL